MQDELGFSNEHYAVMMRKAAELCSLRTAAEKHTKSKEKQVLLDRVKQIQEHLDKCKKLHCQSLLSTSCLNSVQRELSFSLRDFQKQAASIQQHMDCMNTADQDEEVLSCVLNIVADGCRKQRHSFNEQS